MSCLINVESGFPIQTDVINHRFLTLYDLIETVQGEVRPKDDNLVIDVVIGSLKSGKVKFLNSKSIRVQTEA